MAEIAKIKLPDGVTYDIKDATARASIAAINNWEYMRSSDAATTPKGVTWHNGPMLITGTLSASADTMYKIYLVPDDKGSLMEKNLFREFITLHNTSSYGWEEIGRLEADLSGYAQKGDPVTVSGTAESHTTGISVATTIPATTSLATHTHGTNVTVSSKKSGSNGSGSFTQGTFTGGSFTQGTDSFTANTPTVIDTSKFSGGSFTRGTFSQGTLPSATYTAETELLTLTVGTLPTHAADSFTAAKLNSGFYTAGTAASFTQGEDSFTPATHGTDTHVHTAPTWTFENKTVAAAPTAGSTLYVPSLSASGNITGTSTVTDNGHTHTVNATGTIDE